MADAAIHLLRATLEPLAAELVRKKQGSKGRMQRNDSLGPLILYEVSFNRDAIVKFLRLVIVILGKPIDR